MEGLAKSFTEEESSTVKRIRYIKDSQILEVEFQTGSVYRYYKVEKELWNEAIKAPSIGSFLNQKVKGIYKYQLMN